MFLVKWRFFFKVLRFHPRSACACFVFCVCSYWKMAIYFVLCFGWLFFLWLLFVTNASPKAPRAKWKLKGSIYNAIWTSMEKALADGLRLERRKMEDDIRNLLYNFSATHFSSFFQAERFFISTFWASRAIKGIVFARSAVMQPISTFLVQFRRNIAFMRRKFPFRRRLKHQQTKDFQHHLFELIPLRSELY